MFHLKKLLFIAGAVTALSAQSANPFYFDEEEEEYEQDTIESYRTEQIIVSDDRTAIKSITNPSDILRSVRGVYFNWNTQKYPDSNFPSSRQTGVVTEDLSAVLPGSYTQNRDGAKLVNSEAMVALLIEVVKEQNVKIDELQQALIRYKSGKNQSDHETTTYLSQVVELRREVQELKELIGNPVVNVHLHYDEEKKSRKKPRASN